MTLKQDLCRITEQLGDAFGLPSFCGAFYAGGESFTVCRGCDEDTLFAIASCTKSFTAAVLLKLTEEGGPGIDTPVSRIVPRMQLQDKALRETLTLRDLLCHASGLPACDLAWYPYITDFTEEDLFRVLKEIRPNAPRGTLWQYNNLGYALLGTAVEKLSGKSWRGCVLEYILNPLGIEAVFSGDEASARKNAAEPHEWKNGSAVKVERVSIGAVAPAGALYMSAPDLLKWNVCLLHEGMTESGRLLSGETVRQMLTPQICIEEENGPEISGDVRDKGYALGFQTEVFRGERLLFHTGSIDGFHAVQCILPERDFAAVLLCNLGGTKVREAFRYGVCGRVLNAGVDYVSAFAASEETQRERDCSVCMADLKGMPRDLPGTFYNPLFGAVTLEQTDDGLIARLGHFCMPVFREQGGLIVQAPEIGKVPAEFLMDSAGSVKAISMKLEPAADAAVFEGVSL